MEIFSRCLHDLNVMMEVLQNVIPLNSWCDSGARTTLASVLPFLGLDVRASALDLGAVLVLAGDVRRRVFEGGEDAAAGILRFGAIEEGGDGCGSISLRGRVLPLLSPTLLGLLGE